MQRSEKLINNFIIDHFSVKRIKNEKNKWIRAIVIEDGYVRQYKKVHIWNKKTLISLVAVDMIDAINNVLGFTNKETETPVIKYLTKHMF